MRKLIFGFLLANGILAGAARAQDKMVPLYEGKAPGSESWDWKRARLDSNMIHTPVIYNVTSPTLAVFLPKTPNGTALVIAPGGGFHFLSIESEGYEVARYLAAQGVTCYVLEYRLIHTVTQDPVQEAFAQINNRKKSDSIVDAAIPFGVADGLHAVEWVRNHAAEYKIEKDRIGIIGFSAGGSVAMGVALQCTEGNRPNFVAPIYAYVPASWKLQAPQAKMPAFVVAATDDQLYLQRTCLDIYRTWMEGKQIAELHLYAKGGHGFGMRTQHLPTDSWIARFSEWLQLLGYIPKSS